MSDGLINLLLKNRYWIFIALWLYIKEGADRVRGRGEMRRREGGEEGEGGGR